MIPSRPSINKAKTGEPPRFVKPKRELDASERAHKKMLIKTCYCCARARKDVGAQTNLCSDCFHKVSDQDLIMQGAKEKPSGTILRCGPNHNNPQNRLDPKIEARQREKVTERQVTFEVVANPYTKEFSENQKVHNEVN